MKTEFTRSEPRWTRSLERVLVLCLLGIVGIVLALALPRSAFADGPITIAQMERIWWSAGDQNNGVAYSNGDAWWDPLNWSVGGVDCSSYVGNVWQVRQISDVQEALPRGQDINTSNLRCSNDYWYEVPRNLASVAKGDAFVSDDDCYPTLEDHTFIYGWGDPCLYCSFAVFEATCPDANLCRVVHRSRTANGSYVVKRRQNIQEPGLIGRKDNNTNQGDLRQPIVDAFNRNGGYGNVGDIRWNGGGFLVHRWGNGYTQDFDGGSGGAGAIMRADSNSSVAWWIHGAIWDWYVKERGPGGWLGYPTSDQTTALNYCGSSQPRSYVEGGYITYDSCNKYRWRSFTSNNQVPLHRYYIPSTGKHFYTDNYYQGDLSGGNHEGIMGYMRPGLTGSTKALYRWFNPGNNDHLYTDNPYERPPGYNDEGVEGYVYQSGGGGYVPIHRLYYPPSGEHFYTNSDAEKDYLVSIGWNYEGIVGYLFSTP